MPLDPRGRMPLSAEDRAGTKQWLDNWKRVGPILEADRWRRVAALTDEQAQEAARLVFELWQPDWPTDEGEGLLLFQRVMTRAGRPA